MQTENRWVYQSKRRSPTDRRRFLSSLSLAPLPLKVSPSGSTERLPAPLPAVFRQLCRGPVLTTHLIAWFHHGHQTCAESKHQLLCQTDTTFMSRIITGDESWVSCYDPETKQHMPLAETAVSKPEAVTLGQEWKQKHFFLFIFKGSNRHICDNDLSFGATCPIAAALLSYPKIMLRLNSSHFDTMEEIQHAS